jgi:hypothetical protein
MKDKRMACRILAKKPEGDRQFGKHRRRWKPDIEKDLK